MKNKYFLYVSIGVCAAAFFGVYVLYNTTAFKIDVSTASASQLRDQKKYWGEVIHAEGKDEAYAKFLALAPTLSLSTHEQAHAFGEALYEVAGLNGLSACDSSFEFGCYHSFFGVAVQAEGIEVLPQFDEACKTKYGDRNLPCQHGIGHGVMVYADYDNLTKALELCQTISNLPTGGCSSGVFMEYNFHAMDTSTSTYVRRKSENVFEPCDALPAVFQDSCYNEQVQWWQTVFKNDFAYIGTLCQTLPYASSTYEACFHGIGNYVAVDAKKEYQGIIDRCMSMPNEETKSLCHEGASWLVIFDEGNDDNAKNLCTVLKDPYQTTCLERLR